MRTFQISGKKYIYKEKYNSKGKRINSMPVSVEYQNQPGFSIYQSYQTNHNLLNMHGSNIVLLFGHVISRLQKVD